ncbi:MAG TPA: hypothetical protein P5205_17390 [Candidatus Paceibacterota bacterium]|nr:hypothetical protein [Candidatus Paceibacterota bacterium]
MKSQRVFKSFSALPLDEVAAPGAPAPAQDAFEPVLMADAGPDAAATQLDQVRASLDKRYTTPYALSSDYRHWGINE